jgi:hypothetical protein
MEEKIEQHNIVDGIRGSSLIETLMEWNNYTVVINGGCYHIMK